MTEDEFINAISEDWKSIIEAVEVDGFTRPVEKIEKYNSRNVCRLVYMLEDLCKDDQFVPIDGNTKKQYRKWGSKVLPIFEEILGDKEDTVPNSSFTEFQFRSGWGISLEYQIWRMEIMFNVKEMIAKQRERRIDELLSDR